MSDSAYSDWIEHDGGPCPFADGATLFIRAEGHPGDVKEGMLVVTAENRPAWQWRNWMKPHPQGEGSTWARVLAYRTPRTRAIRTLMELAGLKVPEEV